MLIRVVTSSLSLLTTLLMVTILHALFDEVRILMLHGVLHLAGFDHERDRGEMACAERNLRKEFGLPDGLIARARK